VALGWASHLCIACLSVMVASQILQVTFPGKEAVGLLAVVAAAFPINALLHRFLWPIYGYPGEKSRIPSFLPQVAGIIVFLLAAFFGLALFYHIAIAGLLAGSGLIAIIIGLALQDTLGNILAGFGLQAGRAYKVGDWLIVDGKHVEVVEINWRSTRFRNDDDVSFDIPNSQLAKATIVNVYYPSPLHATQQIEIVRNGRSGRPAHIDAELLAAQPLFSCLDHDQLTRLASGSRRIRFGRGERIIRQGDAGDSMFILSRGTAEVLAEKEGRSLPVATLGAGDCFGEISLLTGEPRSATVVAKFDCEVVEIEKQTVGLLLREHPELADSLSETVLARRTATAIQFANTSEDGEHLQLATSKEGLLRRLRLFFHL